MDLKLNVAVKINIVSPAYITMKVNFDAKVEAQRKRVCFYDSNRSYYENDIRSGS